MLVLLTSAAPSYARSRSVRKTLTRDALLLFFRSQTPPPVSVWSARARGAALPTSTTRSPTRPLTRLPPTRRCCCCCSAASPRCSSPLLSRRRRRDVPPSLVLHVRPARPPPPRDRRGGGGGGHPAAGVGADQPGRQRKYARHHTRGRTTSCTGDARLLGAAGGRRISTADGTLFATVHRRSCVQISKRRPRGRSWGGATSPILGC
jgi:hypothetical protein